MLYLIATPIGNLGDLTIRAIKTLEECDYLLCEDTRHSRILFTHYNIQIKKLVSFHKFNEKSREKELIEDLKSGLTIGLLSDAGTPGINDPGEKLVALCRQEDIPVFAIPGACSPIAALTASGLSTERFQFVGFLPPKSGRLERILTEILTYPGTSICFETPHRITKSLKILEKLAPTHAVVVMREITKKFEHYYKGTPVELLKLWKDHPPKGEIVLLIPEVKT